MFDIFDRETSAQPWDVADFAADHVFESILPGYRTHDTNNERGHLVPTPYGDAADTLLSDALPSVLAMYDTVIAPHRLTTEPEETRRKLDEYRLCSLLSRSFL